MPWAPTRAVARVPEPGKPLPRALGVYDRPRFRRSRMLLLLLGAIVVAIVVVWMILLH